jgi:hypothetical protein
MTRINKTVKCLRRPVPSAGLLKDYMKDIMYQKKNKTKQNKTKQNKKTRLNHE